MNTTLLILALSALFLAVVVLAVLTQRAVRRRGLVEAHNIGEGTFDGKRTYIINSTVTAGTHHLLFAPTTSTAGAVAGAGSIPIGTLADLEAGGLTSGEKAAVTLLGLNGTQLVVASEEITVGEEVFPAAGGKVQDAPASGAHYSIGVALSAAGGDNAIIEILPHPPAYRLFA